MIKHVQSFCESLGKNGCYLFCLFDIAEGVTGKDFDVLNKTEYFIKRGWVKFNWNYYRDEDNLYVLDPVKILQHLTGLSWTVRKEDCDYIPTAKDYFVEFWSVDGKSGHFARVSKDFNSLQYSRNVEQGKIKSYRIFNIVE